MREALEGCRTLIAHLNATAREATGSDAREKIRTQAQTLAMRVFIPNDLLRNKSIRMDRTLLKVIKTLANNKQFDEETHGQLLASAWLTVEEFLQSQKPDPFFISF